jgi:hypothetical protein
VVYLQYGWKCFFFDTDCLVLLGLPYLDDTPFLESVEVSAVMFLNKLSMLLVYISSLFSIPMIQRFVFMVSQRSYIFHSYSLSSFSLSLTDLILLLFFLSWYSIFQLILLC